jgi:hypothetical protein
MLSIKLLLTSTPRSSLTRTTDGTNSIFIFGFKLIILNPHFHSCHSNFEHSWATWKNLSPTMMGPMDPCCHGNAPRKGTKRSRFGRHCLMKSTQRDPPYSHLRTLLVSQRGPVRGRHAPLLRFQQIWIFETAAQQLWVRSNSSKMACEPTYLISI